MDRLREGARVLLANIRKMEERLERYGLTDLDKINPIDLDIMLKNGKITVEELESLAEGFQKLCDLGDELSNKFENNQIIINDLTFEIKQTAFKKKWLNW